MSWYDVLSRVYDASLEPLYRAPREAAADALDVRPGSVILDLPCGTGQSAPYLAKRLGPQGRVVGVDLSEGMLREASRRVAAAGWTNVHTLRADARTLSQAQLDQLVGAPTRPDRLHIFLGMSVFPEHEAVFQQLWSLLAPGGRCVIADVYSARPNLQGLMVNVMAQADIRRRTWEPLQAVGDAFERRDLPSPWHYGGQMFLATALKPR
jgi:ubiquinone/menaquinone biosynthesis C-methylase UbiE